MRKPEQSLWNSLQKMMFGYWHAERIENSLNANVPDVLFSLQGLGSALLELKVLSSWPKTDIPVKVPHFTQGQRDWLKKHWENGGRVFVLIQVIDEYFLFRGEASWEFPKFNRSGWHAISDGYWKGRMARASFMGALRGDSEMPRKVGGIYV